METKQYDKILEMVNDVTDIFDASVTHLQRCKVVMDKLTKSAKGQNEIIATGAMGFRSSAHKDKMLEYLDVEVNTQDELMECFTDMSDDVVKVVEGMKEILNYLLTQLDDN